MKKLLRSLVFTSILLSSYGSFAQITNQTSGGSSGGFVTNQASGGGAATNQTNSSNSGAVTPPPSNQSTTTPPANSGVISGAAACKQQSNSAYFKSEGGKTDPYRPHKPRDTSGKKTEFATEATGNQYFQITAYCRTLSIYRYLESAMYIYAGIGLAVMALFAFIGRFRWAWFFAFMGGLFILAASQSIVNFLS